MSHIRTLITISGCVQGVGFRPFIYRLANSHNLVGYIRNTCSGVRIEVQGNEEEVLLFIHNITSQKPHQSTITKFETSQLTLTDDRSFQIKKSLSDSESTLALLPDTAICTICLQELFNPTNRRYLYPFLHCVSCGPRFSLFTDMPFDRDHTTMNAFPMCEKCTQEYENPTNRRFHSQTNCCSTCGPQLQLLDNKKNILSYKEAAIQTTAYLLEKGKIIAIKNTGGYLLVVDATNEKAVQQLRALKKRPDKPFALLMPNLLEAEAITHIEHVEKESLLSPASPIVFMKKRMNTTIAPSVAKGSPYYGLMLPHNGLQYLLFQHFPFPLVATSGNISGQPLCINEKEVFSSLSSIADAFLIHNRAINHRLDDSIVHIISNQPVVLRKARGMIPCSLELPQSLKSTNLFATGSQMKNTFSFLKQNALYTGQYIGDLESADTCTIYEKSVSDWENLLSFKNSQVIGDTHPHYYTSEYIKKFEKTSTIQHHQAHLWACAIDNNIAPPFLGIAWDGSGWGDDETIWGGEAFLTSKTDIKRVATLYPFTLQGGEKAVQEPRRSLLGIVYSMFGAKTPPSFSEWEKKAFTEEEKQIFFTAHSKKIHTFFCSSMGRLFDGVSALLGLCWKSTFEGQAALLLEKEAYRGTQASKQYEMPLIEKNHLVFMDWRLMIEQMLDEIGQGVLAADIALAFHETLARSIVELARKMGEKKVLLSGGVMQNKLLVEKSMIYLQSAGFEPYIHRTVPPNDGGISVGQIIGTLHVLSATR